MQVLLFRHAKQTNKNVADTTFKSGKRISHDQYLLERYPKLGGQSRTTYVVAIIIIFPRFLKDILGVTNFFVEKNIAIVT